MAGLAVDSRESRTHPAKIRFALEGLAIERERASELALFGARPGEQRVPVRRFGRELLELGESLARESDQAQSETLPSLRIPGLKPCKLLKMRARLAGAAERKIAVGELEVNDRAARVLLRSPFERRNRFRRFAELEMAEAEH